MATKKIVKIEIPQGLKSTTCKSVNCGRKIFFVVMASGKAMPVDPDETPHWATCPDSKEFKKKAAAQADYDRRVAEIKAGR